MTTSSLIVSECDNANNASSSPKSDNSVVDMIAIRTVSQDIARNTATDVNTVSSVTNLAMNEFRKCNGQLNTNPRENSNVNENHSEKWTTRKSFNIDSLLAKSQTTGGQPQREIYQDKEHFVHSPDSITDNYEDRREFTTPSPTDGQHLRYVNVDGFAMNR